LPKKEVRNTSKTCHRCGHVAQIGAGRIYKCPKCGMEYDRDLNACINIARRLMRSAGRGSCELPKPAYEGKGREASLNAGSSRLQSWSSSLKFADKLFAKLPNLSYRVIIVCQKQ